MAERVVRPQSVHHLKLFLHQVYPPWRGWKGEAVRGVLRLEPDIFRLVMDAIMIAAGLAMLWTAATS